MKSVALVVFPGFQLLDAACLTAFELANGLQRKPIYRLAVVSAQGGPVMSSVGVALHAETFMPRRHDTVLMTGSTRPEPAEPKLLTLLRQAQRSARRLASICTGAFVLAEAGLLDGRRATTHWNHGPRLQRAYPLVKVEVDRIYVQDGKLWSSAGMTAGIDLALALIQDDLGRPAARAVAKLLVVHHQRSGGQSQFSALSALEAESSRIQSALGFAKERLHERLSVSKLAEVACLSPRQFSRAFRAATGHTPAKAIEMLRLEAARALLSEGAQSFDKIASATGFASGERMRRAFLRTSGLTPQAIRRAAMDNAHD